MDLVKFSLSFVFFASFLHAALGQKIKIETFHTLNEINQRWLQYTSVPETARLLQLPPYRYFSRNGGKPAGNTELYASPHQLIGGPGDSGEGKCSKDVVHTISNIDSDWAIQMLDSDGKLSSGIKRGGLIWPGHFLECTDVYAPLADEGYGDFHGQYCVTSWYLNLTEQYSQLPLLVGLCLPDSCHSENLEYFVRNVSHALSRYPVLKKYESYITLDKIICKADGRRLDVSSIVYLTVISGFIFITILGTVLAVYSKREPVRVHQAAVPAGAVDCPGEVAVQVETSVSAEVSSVAESTNIPSKPKLSDASLEGHFASNNDKSYLTTGSQQSASATSVKSNAPKKESVTEQILLCFDAIGNGERILNTQTSEGQLLTVHGVRFLSLTWVIMGHTYISAVAMIGNKIDVLKDIDTFAFQMLLQAPFSVDSFFLLGGFLLAYLFLKEAEKKNGKINWLYFYLHRLWRLTPAYLVVVFFFIFVFKYFGAGPFWHDDNCDENRSSWWMYVLYINNFIPVRQMCVGWSWYLANDMQFYVISPLFLYPLWRWPKAGFAFLACLLAATWSTTAALSYKYGLIPMFVGVTNVTDFSAYEDSMWDSFDLIYDKPYCRIAPYIIGVVLGYFLHKVHTTNRRNFMTWWQQLLGWAIAAFCSLSVVFGLYHVHMNDVTSMFYNTLCRSSFVIGLAWLIFVCETGHGGFLAKFLSWKLWIPLSRLTYCAYLVHPILIHGYYQSYQTAVHFTQYFAVTNFLGFLLMSYVLAFLFSLVFESPLMNLEKLLVKQKRSRRD